LFTVIVNAFAGANIGNFYNRANLIVNLYGFFFKSQISNLES